MKIRAVSAIFAIILIALTTQFFRAEGLEVFCSIVVLFAIFEYSRLTLTRLESPLHIKFTFIALCEALFLSVVWGTPAFSLGFGAIATVILIAMILMTVRTADDLKTILQIQTFAVLGLSYCGVFTGFTVRLLTLPHGEIWFFGLLVLVFSGDTFAYLAGRAFGKHKLLEPVSPKKTLEGALGGLVGSALAGLILGLLCFKEFPLGLIVLMALITGAFAQVGDLFESLLKRVADVKDSGRIMPGHGGFLDRLDGVLFAAPIYYALVSFLLSP